MQYVPDLVGLMENAQTDAQQWHDLLWASGGALELSKCSYHLLSYEFDSKGDPFPVVTSPMEMTVKSIDGEDIPIRQLSPFKAHKTLGNYKTPEGQDKEQFAASMKNALEIATGISQSTRTPFPKSLEIE